MVISWRFSSTSLLTHHNSIPLLIFRTQLISLRIINQLRRHLLLMKGIRVLTNSRGQVLLIVLKITTSQLDKLKSKQTANLLKDPREIVIRLKIKRKKRQKNKHQMMVIYAAMKSMTRCLSSRKRTNIVRMWALFDQTQRAASKRSSFTKRAMTSVRWLFRTSLNLWKRTTILLCLIKLIRWRRPRNRKEKSKGNKLSSRKAELDASSNTLPGRWAVLEMNLTKYQQETTGSKERTRKETEGLFLHQGDQPG